MKNLYSFYILLLLALAATMYSCDKYTDVHKEYIKDGEIVYAPKPDSVAFISGKGRLKMRLWMYNGVNVKELVVLWNSHKDSLVIPVQFKKGRDSIEANLANMAEKTYSFDIYSVDNFGNKSLLYTQFGSSYGDMYAGTLLNRRVKDLVLTDLNGQIEWYAAPQGMIFTEIRYTGKDGGLHTARMPAGDFNVTIDVKAATTFEHRSLYIPESESIDTFYTEWVGHPTAFPSTYMYNREGWSVLAVSDETASDGGGKNTLLDGDLSSYWHSQWDPSNAPLPHWAVIDMKTSKKAAYLEIYRRPGNTDAKTVLVYIGNDSDAASPSWTLIGTGVYPSTPSDKLTVNATSNASGRYLKLVVTESYRVPFSSIAEVYVYGN
ncbi:MAG: discoidin domain-containing protein [Niabella sp.]|nr:discoidin domain-containing protein [Niabella sp.]